MTRIAWGWDSLGPPRTVNRLSEISKEYDVQRTKSIAILGIGPSGMIHSTENRTTGIPRICVEHRNLLEQEDLELHQCRNFRMIQFGKVKLRLQLGIQLKKRV